MSSKEKNVDNEIKSKDKNDKKLSPYDIFLMNAPEYMKSTDGACIIGID